MIKTFKINYHSFIDVITNSSTEMFISTNKKVIEFFQSMFTEDEIKYSGLSIMSFSDYYKDYDLGAEKANYPDVYEKRWGSTNDYDLILILNVDYGVSDGIIGQVLEKLEFINIYD